MAEPSSAEDLYALDPTEFTAARDALARALRAEGRREESAEVKKLRRPPQSAWALNRLARAEPDLIDAVLQAATTLRDALADGDGDRRAAQDAYRAAIDAAVATAASLVGITGDDMRMRIRTNLLAAGVDETVAVQLQQGTLPDDQEAPGFGGTPTIGPIARPARSASPRPNQKQKQKQKGNGKRNEPQDRDEAPAAEARARAQAEADELARRRVARQRAELEREVGRLEKKADRLTGQAVAAEERAAEARRAADEATAALTDAAERLAQL